MAKDIEEQMAYEEEERQFEALNRQMRIKRWASLIIFAVLLVGIGSVVWLKGQTRLGDKLLSELPEELEVTMGDPDWVEGEKKPVKIISEPEGALIVVNGVLQKDAAPATVEFSAHGPNAVMLFLQDHEPQHVVVSPDAPIGQGLTFTMEETPDWSPSGDDIHPMILDEDGNPVPPEYPKDPRYAELTIKAENPDTEGASAWVDGVLVGKLPVTVDRVRRGYYHHVLVKAEGKAPYVAIFKVVHDIDLIALSLKDSVYIDRISDIWVEPRPKDVQVHIGAKEISGGMSDAVNKGQTVHVQAHLAEYESWSTVVHTTPVGQYYVRPSLVRPVKGKSLVHWRIPEGKYWYPCLKRPRQSVCWDSAKVREPMVIESGEYELIAWEQVGNNIKDKRYATNKPTITIEANKAYSISLDLELDAVELDHLKGVDFDEDNPERAYKALKISPPKS